MFDNFALIEKEIEINNHNLKMTKQKVVGTICPEFLECFKISGLGCSFIKLQLQMVIATIWIATIYNFIYIYIHIYVGTCNDSLLFLNWSLA